VVKELPGEQADRASRIENAAVLAKTTMGAFFSRDVRFDNEQISRAIDDFLKTRLIGTVGVMLRKHAIDLVNELRKAILLPLRTELKRATEEATAFVATAEFRDLASGPIPDHLRPSKNEILLQSVDDFPAELERQLNASFGSSVADAVGESVVRMFDDASLPQRVRASHRLVEIGSWAWRPTAVAPPPSVKVRVDVDHMARRAHAWLRADTTTGIGRFLAESLESYLTAGSTSEVADKVERFGREFDGALSVAEPLVQMNTAVMSNQFTGARTTPSYALTGIPLTMGNAARAKAEEVLIARKIATEATVADFFADGTAAPSISISTQSAALPSFALEDYRTRVVSKWVGAGKPGFGQWRRARRRFEAVPVPGRVLAAFARGWTLGGALGLIQLIDQPKPGGSGSYPVASVLGSTGTWLSLPVDGPEGLPDSDDEVFGAVLEAYGLCELGAVAKPAAPELAGYERVLEFDSRDLRLGWAATGKVHDAALPLDFTATTPEGRLRELWEHVAAQIKHLGQIPPDEGLKAAASGVLLGRISRRADWAVIRLPALQDLLSELDAEAATFQARPGGGPRRAS
jgi:hypothetical protein